MALIQTHNHRTSEVALRMGLSLSEDDIPYPTYANPSQMPRRSVFSSTIKPRYDRNHLQVSLHTTIQQIKRVPIEYYEVKLHTLTVKYRQELGRPELNFQAVSLLHHIVRLEEDLSSLQHPEIDEIFLQKREIQNTTPEMLEEYRLISDFIPIISGLLVKSGLFLQSNYNFRTDYRTTAVRLLDITHLSESILSLDTLWLANSIDLPSFHELITEEIRQFAIILIHEFVSLLNFMVNISPENLSDPEIVTFHVSNRKTQVKNYIKVHPESGFLNTPLVYLQLKGINASNWCCCEGRQAKLMRKLREKMSNFEEIYRIFEMELVKCLVSAEHHT